MVKTSDYEKIVEQKFDSFCKTVLRNCAKNIYVENKRRNEKCISLELITQNELSQFAFYETYNAESTCFTINEYSIFVKRNCVKLLKKIEIQTGLL